MPRLAVFHADNLAVLRALPDACVDLIYIDPPFNTGRVQRRTHVATVRDDNGDRIGFKGQLYRTIRGETSGYDDRFDDFLGFLQPRMEEAYRILSPEGSLFFHLDYREIHYCKVMLDGIFGRASFINEIIWAYDYGARSKTRWPAKHDNILWYAKNPESFTFNFDAMDRIPYMAPGLVGPRKAALGKTPTDVWWHTIVCPNSREKTGYATQKPRAIIDRIVKVHSRPGDVLCDFFAGSGTLGESAAALGRSALLVDSNIEAVRVMKRRFAGLDVLWRRGAPRAASSLELLKEAAAADREAFRAAEQAAEKALTGAASAGSAEADSPAAAAPQKKTRKAASPRKAASGTASPRKSAAKKKTARKATRTEGGSASPRRAGKRAAAKSE